MGEEWAVALAGRLAAIVPPAVEVRHAGPFLFVYRPGAVEPIIASDPRFYRPRGVESTWQAILGVTPERNGELLGYGARSYDPAGRQVRIFDPSDPGAVFAGFTVSPDPELAIAFTQERLAEIADRIGRPLAFRFFAAGAAPMA